MPYVPSVPSVPSAPSARVVGEAQPLIPPMAQPVMGKICFLSIVCVSVWSWCILDWWNHDVSSVLFQLSDGSDMQINPITGQVIGEAKHPFTFVLTLAFFQFAFMGVVFLGFWYLLSRHPAADFEGLKENMFSAQWGGLVTTHVFSIVWLPSLMTPATMMTPMVFAASRALDIPTAAVMRSRLIGDGHFQRFGGHPPTTTILMCGAAMLIIFSQTRIAECFCMWSGHGVQLAGISLFVIYGLVLVVPAANTVFMESVMVNLDTHPLLMLSAMNLLACLCFVPVLAFAWYSGLEDVFKGISLTMKYPQLYLLVLWLCAQSTLIEAVTVALIRTLDSFWAVSLRCFKPVVWWLSKLVHVFLFSEAILSIDRPDVSFWGFIMLCGVCLVGAAAIIDSNTKDPVVPLEAKTEGGKV